MVLSVLAAASRAHTQNCLQLSVRCLSSSALPRAVTLYEVGPRDGLQNEKGIIDTQVKVDLINMLSAAGLRKIEATSFVSPKWVPQLGDASEVMARITRKASVSYPVLIPNIKGFQNALKAGVSEVAIFAAASEAFSKKNTNCTIAESLKRFEDVTAAAREANVAVRGYVSCVVGCPYQGDVDAQVAADVASALLDMGCYEVAMSDTTGVGTPASVEHMFKVALQQIPAEKLGAHMHDTYGQALVNILTSLRMGVATIDSSVAGLGGCPYAAGASGNVATEDVVYMLEGYGIQHGVDLQKLLEASEFICKALGRENSSRVAKALVAKKQRAAAAA